MEAVSNSIILQVPVDCMRKLVTSVTPVLSALLVCTLRYNQAFLQSCTVSFYSMVIRFLYSPWRKKILRVNQALMWPGEARIKRQSGQFQNKISYGEQKFLSRWTSQNFSLFVKLSTSETWLLARLGKLVRFTFQNSSCLVTCCSIKLSKVLVKKNFYEQCDKL